MADRPVVSEVIQIGVESTAGTAVTATKKLQALTVELDTAAEFDQFGPSGNLFNTISVPRQEWSSGSISGYPTYTELAYVLSNVLGAATITTPSGATSARKWTWAVSSTTPWAPKTWTIERGVSGDTAEQAAYAVLSGINMSFSRTAAPEIGGDLFARRLDYTATLATGATTLNNVPILATEVDVYADSASGSIGSTKLTRSFNAGFSLGGLFNPVWSINSALTSFGTHVIAKPDATASLQLGNDSVGRAYVDLFRGGDTKFVRIQAVGPTIETGHTYKLTIDLAVKVTDAPSRSDVDGLSTLDWSFGLVHDSGWGKALNVELITDIAAL